MKNHLILSEIELIKLRDEVNRLVYSNNYVTSPDSDTIMYAKQIARKHKIKYQDILKDMRPLGSIQCRVWDENGKIVEYKKIFY